MLSLALNTDLLLKLFFSGFVFAVKFLAEITLHQNDSKLQIKQSKFYKNDRKGTEDLFLS